MPNTSEEDANHTSTPNKTSLLSIFLQNAKKLPQFDTATIVELLDGVPSNHLTPIQIVCTGEMNRQILDELGEAVVRALLNNPDARNYILSSVNLAYLVNILDFDGVNDDDLPLFCHRCVLLLLLAKVDY